MNAQRSACLAAFILAVAQLMPAPALAQTCTFGITDMTFGVVDTLSGGHTDSTASLTYNCSGGGASERILVCAHLYDGSVASSGGVRRMAGGSAFLGYQLYQGADRTTAWGGFGSGLPDPPPIAVVLDDNGAASGQVSIYGRVFGGQSTVPTGAYLASFSGGQIDIRYRVTGDSSCASLAGTQAAATSFDVEASAEANCLVATEPVNFGAQGVLRSNVDAEGKVSVMCTPATDYAISLNGGNADAAPAQRKMAKGTETITYGLYKNGTRDQPWGDASLPGSTVGGIGNGSYQGHTVYGRVPPQSTPSTGIYTDTVIVTVTY